MKILIMSDLHLTHEGYELSKGLDFDVLVLAGDIVPYYNRSHIETLVRNVDIPVIMVPGNHEYYDSYIQYTPKIDNVILLREGLTTIDGVTFAGTTLWSNPTPTDFVCTNDGYYIGGLNIWREHRKAREFLSEDWKADVVITHFPPSTKSRVAKYAGRLDSYFINDIGDEIGKHGEKLWIHGHTHSSLDYEENGVRVVCNPKGYGTENPDFKHNLIVEI